MIYPMSHPFLFIEILPCHQHYFCFFSRGSKLTMSSPDFRYLHISCVLKFTSFSRGVICYGAGGNCPSLTSVCHHTPVYPPPPRQLKFSLFQNLVIARTNLHDCSISRKISVFLLHIYLYRLVL